MGNGTDRALPRSEHEVNDGYPRCPRERRCKARDAVTMSLTAALGCPELSTMERPDRAVEA
jgi:hypothetical protein